MSGTTGIHVAAEVLQVFRQLCVERLDKQDVPPNIVIVFAEIAANPGRSHTELRKATGLGQAVISRSVAALGDGSETTGDGLGLVTSDVDPSNVSRKIVSLTADGKALLKQINDRLVARGFK
jgi:DNA-binding MarR family transcriptional regulator